MKSFRPRNKTAQLFYQGTGNPPASHPSTAVGNFFPGLEFNFLNIWKRVFVGIELVESSAQVITVHPGEARNARARKALEDIENSLNDEASVYLVRIDYRPPGGTSRTIPLLRYATGPGKLLRDRHASKDDPEAGSAYFLEWPNALGQMHHVLGGRGVATCHFVTVVYDDDGNGKAGGPVPVELEVRRLIDEDTALISRRTTEPGEITESLCSPWQTDYIGCACFYWASNRPDFVNVEEVPVQAKTDDGKLVEDTWSLGHHWLDVPLDSEDRVKRDVRGRIKRTMRSVTLKDGTEVRKPFYTLKRKWDGGPLLKHEDVLKEWESKLEFIIGGKDTPDGVVPPAPEDAPAPDRIGVGPGLQGSVRVDGGGAPCDETGAAAGGGARDRTRAPRRVARRGKASVGAKRKKR